MDPSVPSRNRPRQSLPRTRGDGPGAPAGLPQASPSSPHARGWTLSAGKPCDCSDVFPARAGMDPRSRRPAAPRLGLPRTRGDGPVARPPHLGHATSSPHARGWTRRSLPSPVLPPVFPARAGMDPFGRARALPAFRLPRTRGDGPAPDLTGGRVNASSPHARGWTRASRQRTRPSSVFPARAGMDPRRRFSGCRFTCLPRTRGDGPAPPAFETGTAESSPHARGWTLRRRCPRGASLVFPARAGMDRSGTT